MKDITENNGLEIAENLLVWGSVAGNLVAVFAQQAIYATAPMTLALLLNLSNRHRFELKLERNIATVVSKMNSRVAQSDRELAEQMRSLQASVQVSLADKSVNDTTQQEVSQLQTRFDDLEKAISSLKSTIADSNSQKETSELTTTFDPTYLEQQIEQLKTALIDKQQTTSETANKQELEKCQQEIQKLQRNLSLLNSELQTSKEQQQIEQLRHVEAIQQQMQAIANTKPQFDPSNIEQQIQKLQVSLSSLNVELQTSKEQQQIEQLRHVEAIQQQMQAIANTKPQFDPSNIEQQIQKLQVSLSSLNVELQTSKEQQQIEELRQIVEAIQKASTSPAQTPFDLSDLEQENQKLKTEIQSIKQELQASSSQEFNSEIARLPQLFENFTQEMQQQISELKQKTDMLSHLETEIGANRLVARSKRTELDNRKQLSVEALMAMAKSNGIGEEFQQVLEVANRFNLGLIPKPTNLMFTPANHLVFTIPSNYSRCLFIVSAQPTDAGKVQIWMSPKAIAEFYPAMKEAITSSLGFFDGWREMDKAEVEEFVASLNQVFALTTAN